MPDRYRTTHVILHMVSGVGIEQGLAVNHDLADVRIEIQQPLGLVGRRAAAQRELPPLAEIIPIEGHAVGEQLGHRFPAVQRREFQVLAVLQNLKLRLEL